jgi:hypothetical protein
VETPSEKILQRGAAMSTNWPWNSVCRRLANGINLCGYCFWHRLGTELLNAILVHHAWTGKQMQWLKRRLTLANSLQYTTSLVQNNVSSGSHIIVMLNVCHLVTHWAIAFSPLDSRAFVICKSKIEKFLFQINSLARRNMSTNDVT